MSENHATTEKFMASYQEILNQIEALKVQAEDVRKQELTGAITEIKRLMGLHGITLADLGISPRSGKTKARSTVAPKYRDPVSGSTWTGRGRRPAWVVAWEASGKSLDECKV